VFREEIFFVLVFAYNLFSFESKCSYQRIMIRSCLHQNIRSFFYCFSVFCLLTYNQSDYGCVNHYLVAISTCIIYMTIIVCIFDDIFLLQTELNEHLSSIISMSKLYFLTPYKFIFFSHSNLSIEIAKNYINFVFLVVRSASRSCYWVASLSC